MPGFDSFREPGPDSVSFCTIHSDAGLGVTLWSRPESAKASKTGLEVRLELSPQKSVIIGRQNGGHVPYLDPSYVSTPIVPGDGQTILQKDGRDQDVSVSRGHFLMRGDARGILFVNGVPRPGGGLRAPVNGAYLLYPEVRWLHECEEYLIERGAAVSIRLPNGTALTIQAE